MTKYTDEQLNEALSTAARNNRGISIESFSDETEWHQDELQDLRAILDALPEPATDDWQECGFEDIQKGDRVKVVDTHEAGDQTVYEGDVVQVSKGLVMTAHHQLHSVYNSKWYRIPAPVQHPDPLEHPVIIVGGAYDIDWDHAYAYVSDGTGYNIVEPLNSDSRLLPEAIHNWSPAKVVEDDR